MKKNISDIFRKSLFCAAVVLAAGCQPDPLTRGDVENISTLTVKGTLLQNEKEYDAVVDEATKTVTLYAPYYISDTEAIMSDLSQVKFHATMPLGARFEPGLSGIRDMSDGKTFQQTMIKENGETVLYTFKAERKKSDAAKILKAVVTDENIIATIGISDPAEAGKNGKLTAMKTSSQVEEAFKSVVLTVSPWATVEAEGYDKETGIIDLSVADKVTVTAQDGKNATVYDISIDLPSLVPSGEIGYITGMFGVQCTKENPIGFEADMNYTMAVVDEYLVVTHRNDFTKMSVYNRFSGQYLENKKVNTSGIDSKYKIRAVSTDADGCLVAMTYTNIQPFNAGALGQDLDMDTPTDIRVWIWKNGIEAAPELILEDDINSATFKALVPNPVEIGNTIYVKGSLSTGDAVIATVDKFRGRTIGLFFKDGKYTAAKIYCVTNNGSAQWTSFWNSTKAIPLNIGDPMYYVMGSCIAKQTIYYYSEGSGNGSLVEMKPPKKYWWSGSKNLLKDIRGVDIIEFNGTRLMAVCNGQETAKGIWAHRLYVSNIGYTPTDTSLESGFIFDSRESTGINGAGYTLNGMTSTYPFDATQKPLGGTNLAARGDVVFHASEDGNSVQVYVMNMNAGIFAFEITKYDM